jgi:hypothetical protein
MGKTTFRTTTNVDFTTLWKNITLHIKISHLLQSSQRGFGTNSTVKAPETELVVLFLCILLHESKSEYFFFFSHESNGASF